MKQNQPVDSNKPKNFVTEILKKLTPKIGATLLFEPEFEYTGLITFSNGKRVFYRNTRFNINPLGSVEVAKDKYYASFFLKHFGYTVTKGQTFFSDEMNDRVEVKRDIDDGYEFIRTIGYPVIVKPNSLSQGSFVTKVHNKKEYYRAAKKILKKTKVLVVEKFYSGNDFRIVVLDGKIISAYKREPLTILGDGTSSIIQLLEDLQNEFTTSGRDTILDLDDYRISMKLKKNKLSFDSVLEKNRFFLVLDNANLSSGGMSFDLTNSIHRDYSDLAINITKDMGLRLCGVDILTDDITNPLNDYTIIEINSAPGLDNYASIGKEQERIVDDLYMQILKSLEKL